MLNEQLDRAATRDRGSLIAGRRGTSSALATKSMQLDYSLRPRSLAEFVGQERIKKILAMSIEAARRRGEVLDHVLFSAPPGLGKTSLAHIIARELGVNLRVTSGPAIERAGDLAAIVNDLDQGDVLFIDEIHRLARVVEEILYPAMEDFELNIVVGKGPGARTMKLAVKPFTMVGATTRSGLLSSPLRDRFGQHYHLDFYAREELTEIVQRSAQSARGRIDDEGAVELAARSRGTPRIANRLLRRVRDFAQVNERAGRDPRSGLGRAGIARDRCVRFRRDGSLDPGGDNRQVRRRPGRSRDVWRRRSARNPTPSATFTSLTSCRRDSSRERHAAAWPRSAPIRIWAVPAAAHCFSRSALVDLRDQPVYRACGMNGASGSAEAVVSRSFAIISKSCLRP